MSLYKNVPATFVKSGFIFVLIQFKSDFTCMFYFPSTNILIESLWLPAWKVDMSVDRKTHT